MSGRGLALACLLLVAATQAVAILTEVSPLLAGRLVDGDCYVRLFRVQAMLEGRGWYDPAISLLNAPDGEILHWTRPFDLLLFLLALPLLPVLGLQQAVWQAGLWISPVLELATLGLLVWGLKPYLSPGGILLAACLFVFQPVIASFFLAARPDHHSLQILLEVAVLAALMRAHGLLAGFAAALALWVSAEALLLVLAAGLFLGLMWIVEGEGERRRLQAFVLGLAVGLTLALMMERPPAQWLAIEYDRLSLAQVGLGWILLLSVLWTAVGNVWAVDWRRRLPLGLGMAAQAAGLLALLFPDFFEGPYGALNPRLVPIWFSLVKEAQPLSFGPKAAILLGPPLLGLGYGLWRLRNAHERRLLGPALCALAIYIPATLYQVRIAAFAASADIAPWTLLILAAAGIKHWRILLLPLLLTGHLILALVIAKLAPGTRDAGSSGVCAWHELAAHVKAEWPGDARPILTYVFPGPELGFLSGHAVVAGPYHRSAQGILDIETALGSADDAPAREVTKRRRIGWIAVCDQESQGLRFSERGGFHARLVQGEAPDWLSPAAAFTSSKGNFRVYEVVR